MKKYIVLTMLMCSILMIGCTSNDKTSNKEEKASKIVYCDKCGGEAKEATKFCSNCGKEAKWLAEKPETLNVKKEDIENKDENKDTTKDVETVKHSYKDEYINKLNSTEDGMSDLDYLYENGTTGEMVEAEGTKLKRWDNMLNEIYSLLKTQLTESEMNELKSKQRSWIEYRDKTAENEASENIGGTLYNVVYNGSLARLTKERCYELVNTYMK
ncbi:MAG: lysozyme inhibitor LprI family protein [Paraclostridium sp.]|uniref:lysozyme inhibitor LprI family protein n=1 Tax=Paraclostridium sp. TaxID=2023273 RepID=UPI003F2B194D